MLEIIGAILLSSYLITVDERFQYLLAFFLGVLIAMLFGGCSLAAGPSSDLQSYVEAEVARILPVTQVPTKRVFVSLPNGISSHGTTDPGLENVVGLAHQGKNRIEIRRDIVEQAYRVKDMLPVAQAVWQLRRILAHEIGHLMGGSSEEAADANGIRYFRQLGWPCEIWIAGFKGSAQKNAGTFLHDPRKRLEQAKQLCLE